MTLITTLEQAEGGSLELNIGLLCACGYETMEGLWFDAAGKHLALSSLNFTGSIDAAIALVREKLPKWRVSALLETARRGPVISPGTWEAALRLREEFEGSDKGYTAATARTAPLALVIALLRALESQP